ncbi:MAG: T9SS type A sorting domain-containing protein [Bacteroidia bacterium]|nr:T9SS type A sorting domain-containing protein [Bacteroidia bacterium]
MNANFTLSHVYSLRILLILSLFGTSSMLSAQITINENIVTDNFNKRFRNVLYETNLDIDAQLQTILADTGANKTWDFANLNYIDSTVVIEEYMPTDPNDPLLQDPNFSNSTFIRKATLYPVDGGNPDTTFLYEYARLDNGSWTTNGTLSISDLDMDGIRDTFLQWFSPPRLEVNFPVSSNSQWSDSSDLVQKFQGMTFISSTFLDSNWVEGWGTLITPRGSAPALRVRNKLITKNPALPNDELGTDIDFVTAMDEIGASIVVEDGRAFHSVRTLLDGATSIYDWELFDFRLKQNYPNPFKQETLISFELDKAAEIDMQLLDIQGKSLKAFPRQRYLPGSHEVILEASDLSPGIYLVQMRIGNQIQLRRIQKL